jgi:hypothetical protein
MVIVTATESGGAEEVVEMQTFYSLNVKASGAARELNHTGTSRLDNDSVANLKAAWQGLFADKLTAHVAAQGGELTRTPAFKKWFGDSKVVDENGDPLVVYPTSRII